MLVLLLLDGFFGGFLLPLIQGMMQGGQGRICLGPNDIRHTRKGLRHDRAIRRVSGALFIAM